MSGRFGPYRSLRSELGSLAVVAVVPLLIFLAFPLEALHPLPPVPAADSEPSCAFVTLTPEGERRSLAAARAAWQLDRDASRRMRIDLYADSLPPMPVRAVLGPLAMPRASCGEPAPYVPDLLPRTLAAPPPARIRPQPDADATVSVFSREELLKID